MTVVETPVPVEFETTIVPAPKPANPLRDTLLKIREKIENGFWIRDRIADHTRPRQGYGCMLGLIQSTDRDYRSGQLISLMENAIGVEGQTEIAGYAFGQKVNGGTVRNKTYDAGRVATFSNTRATKEDMLAWVDRALALVE